MWTNVLINNKGICYMSNYKPQEFAEMIGVSVKTLQLKGDERNC